MAVARQENVLVGFDFDAETVEAEPIAASLLEELHSAAREETPIPYVSLDVADAELDSVQQLHIARLRTFLELYQELKRSEKIPVPTIQGSRARFALSNYDMEERFAQFEQQCQVLAKRA